MQQQKTTVSPKRGYRINRRQMHFTRAELTLNANVLESFIMSHEGKIQDLTTVEREQLAKAQSLWVRLCTQLSRMASQPEVA